MATAPEDQPVTPAAPWPGQWIDAPGFGVDGHGWHDVLDDWDVT